MIAPATGTCINGMVRFASWIPEATYQELRDAAERQGTSVAQQIRDTIRAGLVAIDDVVLPPERRTSATKPQRLARGRRRGDDTIEVASQLSPAVFSAVRARAVRKKTGFSEQVRLLIDWGLGAGDV